MLIKKNKIPILQILLIGFLPSPIKKAFYRFKGYKIGKGVSLGLGSVIIGKDVSIGDYSSLGMITVVRGNKIQINRFVTIGMLTMIDTESIFIDDDARINEKVIIGGIKNPDSSLHVGKRTIIMEYSFINPTKPIVIGDDSGIGGHCLLFTHGSWSNQLEGFPVTFAPITIGERVWLPWRVFIMPGTSVGNDVVIGANSLVSGTIPSNSLIAGSPAKVIKENYPNKPDLTKRRSILSSILSDFDSYLNHNGFLVKKDDWENGSFLLTLNKGTQTWKIAFLLSDTIPALALTVETVVVDGLPHTSLTSKMVIDLKGKQRKGTSHEGEELLKFFSRYGIRLNRLD
jgi:acetyltransferase-like isoleucine patch superfamily enzyme